ncbi:hypothetical protein [Bacillus pumilus]|nr:hypothetical protein [Bacillus pumilus]
MEEGGVNLGLKEKNDMGSINGGAGRGKRRLLKDIFGDLVVEEGVGI